MFNAKSLKKFVVVSASALMLISAGGGAVNAMHTNVNADEASELLKKEDAGVGHIDKLTAKQKAMDKQGEQYANKVRHDQAVQYKEHKSREDNIFNSFNNSGVPESTKRDEAEEARNTYIDSVKNPRDASFNYDDEMNDTYNPYFRHNSTYKNGTEKIAQKYDARQARKDSHKRHAPRLLPDGDEDPYYKGYSISSYRNPFLIKTRRGFSEKKISNTNKTKKHVNKRILNLKNIQNKLHRQVNKARHKKYKTRYAKRNAKKYIKKLTNEYNQNNNKLKKIFKNRK